MFKKMLVAWVIAEGFVCAERDFPTSKMKLFNSSHFLDIPNLQSAYYSAEICSQLILFHRQISMFFYTTLRFEI